MINRNRVPSYKIYDAFEFLFGMMALISSVLSIVSFFANNISSLIITGFITMLAVVFAMFSKILKLRHVATKRLSVFSGGFHSFTDILRDEYYSLLSLSQSNKLTSEQLTIMAEATCQVSVDIIAAVLTESTGEKVCVSIKYFPKLTPKRKASKNIDVDDYVLTTLCRSSNSPQERQGHRLMRVGDNSGFQSIIKYQNSHFRAQDLDKYISNVESSGIGKFTTTNSRWRQYYRSIITVPIRINRAFLPPPRGVKSGRGYHIIGLLCADSMSTSAFRGEEDMDAYTNLLKGYADSLYTYLERIDFYLEKSTKKK